MRLIDPRVRLPEFVVRLYPEAIWRVPTEQKRVYLTFDDGPIPEVTPWVLKILEEEQVDACFFCVGDNVRKYPDVYQSIIIGGHLTGNHTFHHLQGLKTSTKVFFQDILKTGEFIDSGLFRPPHGLMKTSQCKFISKRFKVVMWDIVSCDYRQSLSPEKVINNVLDNVRPGSIITFHDSVKAWKNLSGALPVVIKKLKEKGYGFGSLNELLN